MARISGEYVAEQTITSVHLPDDAMKGRQSLVEKVEISRNI